MTNKKKQFLNKRQSQLTSKIRKTLVKWNQENKGNFKLHMYVRDDRIHYTDLAKASSRETMLELKQAIGINNKRLNQTDKWLRKAVAAYDIFL